MKKLVCPSMMCANFSSLEEEVKELDQGGADIFHIDFMDGVYVPNFGMGLQDFELIRKSTDKLVDVHLMIQNPTEYVEKFADMGADIIYFHPETDLHPTRTLAKIKNKGKYAGLALNPGTSVETVLELLPLVDYLLVMTVNPGFAGQPYLAYVEQKIEKLVHLQSNYHYKIMVDGAISPARMASLGKLGVSGFILGTSALFGQGKKYKECLFELTGGFKL